MVFGFGSSTAAAKPAVVPNVKSISTQDLDEEGWVNVFSQADNVSAAAVNSCTGAASVAKETAEENFEEDYEKGESPAVAYTRISPTDEAELPLAPPLLSPTPAGKQRVFQRRSG